MRVPCGTYLHHHRHRRIRYISAFQSGLFQSGTAHCSQLLEIAVRARGWEAKAEHEHEHGIVKNREYECTSSRKL